MNGFSPPQRVASPYSPSLPFNRGELVTPPQSSSNNLPYSSSRPAFAPELMAGGMDNGRPPDAMSIGPSPPASIANSRSSDGTLSDQQSKKYRRMEGELLRHYGILKAYLRGGASQPPRPNKARDKLLRLTPVQFHELSTDVYDELQRRQAFTPPPGRPSPRPPRDVPPYLLPRQEFHEKRNQARQKLSSLQDSRFRDLSTDVFCELERRFPNFQRMDRGGAASPGPRASSRGRQNPGSTGYPSDQPNGYSAPPRNQSRGPGPGPNQGGYWPSGTRYQSRNGSLSGPMQASGVPRFDNPPLDTDYGRPMPKQFQSNTILPNKSTMVEDEDPYGTNEESDRRSDAFGLEGIVNGLPSNPRDTSTTSQSGGSPGRDAKIREAAQAQVAQLQDRVEDLEMSVKAKDEEIRRLEEETKSSMSSEWVDVRQDLEKKLEDAELLNQSMKEELERLHRDQANVERDLRSQLDSAQKSQTGETGWKDRYDRLEKDRLDMEAKLKEQRKVTEEVREQASGFLREMRAMADGGGGNLEREEKLQSDVQRLEEEVKEWKSRYVRTKTQLRNMRASSLGLSIQRPNAGKITKEDAFTDRDGLVKDVHITKFQIAIDELLHIARAGEPAAVLDYMKAVVVAVRSITKDVLTPPRNGPKEDEAGSRRTKLKSKVSATANNLITASKNFASSNGISPVSLLDAAASHLTAAIVELVRTVKIRPTPAGELEDDDDGSLDPAQSPGYFPVEHSMQRVSGEESIYSAVSSPPSSHARSNTVETAQTQRSLGRPAAPTNGVKTGFGIKVQASELEELKLYLEDQTDTLVHSIQSLVASIRSEDSLPSVRSHIAEIAAAVGSVVSATQSSIDEPSSIAAALKDKAEAGVKTLARCRSKLLKAADDSQRLDASKDRAAIKAFTQRLPPLAFEIARETKELVQKIELVGSADFDDFA